MGDNPIWSRVKPEGMDATGQPETDDDDELPAHERDEVARRTDEQPDEADPAAGAGLPEHERDAQRGYDTGGQPDNP